MRKTSVIALASLALFAGADLAAPEEPARREHGAERHHHGGDHPHRVGAHRHEGPGHRHHARSGLPTLPGQDAFGAIAEIVAILEADPATDWTKVDLEALRRHLVDMHEVVLRSTVAATPVPGGLAMAVTGPERAIRAMVLPHARELDALPDLAAGAEPIAGGVRLVVTAADPADARAVARVRGLGFAGLLTLGAHHQAHHLAVARGEPMHGH